MKFLPATVDGLARRFDQSFKEFTRQGKHEHRNELVFLLDELLRQDVIDEATESTTMEDETREGNLKKIIRFTTYYLIEHDKKELINEFRKDVGEDFLVDIVQELEELIDVYLPDEFLDGDDKN